jgi:hypothetical protein
MIMDLREIGWEGVDGFMWFRTGVETIGWVS